MKKILLFEDKEHERNEIRVAFDSVVNEYSVNDFDLEVIDFEEIKPLVDKKGKAPENALSEYLIGRAEEIGLVVTDHDLTASSCPALSEPVINQACKLATIPLGRYERADKKTVAYKLSQAIQSSSAAAISLDISDVNGTVKEMLNVARGFRFIDEKYCELAENTTLSSPARTLANILDEPSQELKFSQYAVNNSLLSEIASIIIRGKEFSSKNLMKKQLIHRAPYYISYWLYNTILKFPGTLLNRVATYSYLNINEESFINAKHLFEPARYSGPFSETKEYWWCDKLDQIIGEENATDYINERGIAAVSDLNSGFYCILTEKPISLEKSAGGLSWLPMGAFLCRVNKKEYDKYAPLLGL